MDRRRSKSWQKLTKHLQYIGATCVALLMLAGCSSVDTADNRDAIPDWVANPPSDARYLYGVGSAERIDDVADAFKQAERQGNADIANQLRVTVSNRNVQSTQVEQSNSQPEKVMRSMSQVTKVETAPIVLDQSESVERYQSERYVYVLQRLDRQRVVSRLRQQLEEVDLQLIQVANRVSNSQPLVEQWSVLMSALPMLSQRAQYLDLLAIYSKSSTVAFAMPDQVVGLQGKINQLLKELRIQVRDPSDQNPQLAMAVRAALTSKGLTPGQSQAAPLSLSLSSQYDFQQQAGRHYVFVNSKASLQLKDGHQIAAWDLTARGISAGQQQAVSDAENKLSKELAEKLFVWMTTARQ